MHLRPRAQEWGKAHDGSHYLIEEPLQPFASWCNTCGATRTPSATWYKCSTCVAVESCALCLPVLRHPHPLVQLPRAANAPAPSGMPDKRMDLLEALWNNRQHTVCAAAAHPYSHTAPPPTPTCDRSRA